MKKHEDFDRAIKLHENKIKLIVAHSEKMVEQEHSSKDRIIERRDQMLKRSDILNTTSIVQNHLRKFLAPFSFNYMIINISIKLKSNYESKLVTHFLN